ncbi:MAG: DUF559 domain-containing protein [Polyangiaceae bacterium]|nr:DUF559 domain-containing protein [Polyangiaceae bacterium]MBK8943015.1 DUF559 domain-containing protein [Polyangiaceae bacterium]
MRTPHCTIVARATAFRRAPTLTEALRWQALRGGYLGTPFRRQVVLGRFIVDFLAPRAKLVVEVDGEVHSARAAVDARRDRDLARMGLRVLRLPCEMVQSASTRPWRGSSRHSPRAAEARAARLESISMGTASGESQPFFAGGNPRPPSLTPSALRCDRPVSARFSQKNP